MTRHELEKLVEGMTEGPWEIDREEDSYPDDDYLGRGLMAPIQVGPWEVEHEGSARGLIDVVEADAKGTIALRNCAPGLLALLEEAQRYLGDWSQDTRYPDEYVAKLDALLARIDGELDGER